MFTIRTERSADAPARETLLDRAYGRSRFTKPSQRLREGRLPARGLSLVAVEDGRLIGTVRLWDVTAGDGRPALLLGPLAVDPDCRNRGIGSALTARAVDEARRRGHRAILLVGDAPFYGRFGFSAEKTAKLRMPGPYAPERLLACELEPGALDGAQGRIAAAGRQTPADSLSGLIAGLRPTRRRAAGTCSS